jgi:hypothetical protein
MHHHSQPETTIRRACFCKPVSRTSERIRSNSPQLAQMIFGSAATIRSPQKQRKWYARTSFDAITSAMFGPEIPCWLDRILYNLTFVAGKTPGLGRAGRQGSEGREPLASGSVSEKRTH